MLYNFLLGAFSLFLLICLWQFYRALKNGREGQSGVWLAAGLIKPQNILLPGVLLLGARRWKAIAGAVLAGYLHISYLQCGSGLAHLAGFFEPVTLFE